MCPNRCGNDASSSDPSVNVHHEVSVGPVDAAGIDISHPVETPAKISEARLRMGIDL